MSSAKVFISAAFVVFLFSTVSAEIVTEHIATDAEMLYYLSDTLFVAEGRIGDRGGYATFELDVGNDTGAPVQTANYNWQSGIVEPFTVSFVRSTGLVSFSLGGQTLEYTTPYFDFDQIFVRTRAVDAGTSVEVGEIVIDGVGVTDHSVADDTSGLDILWIRGASLNDGFVFQGNAVLTWTGTPPTQSRLAFQIKVGKLGVIANEDFSWGAIKSLDR